MKCCEEMGSIVQPLQNLYHIGPVYIHYCVKLTCIRLIHVTATFEQVKGDPRAIKLCI